MKIVDCIWELKNLDKKTVEISVGKEDVFSRDIILQSISNYEYAVVKVPMDMPTFNIGLSEMGFVCIETQMNVGINLHDFDFSKVAHLYSDTSYELINNDNDFTSVVYNLLPGMFSTDRISLDPQFGEDIACRRYINWLTSEYESKRSQLIKVINKNEHIGFMLIKTDGDTIDLILNGLYKQYQGKGLGILTPASPMMYVKKNSLNITKEVTSISSNNIPVVKLYNRLNFQLLKHTYVFVKHI